MKTGWTLYLTHRRLSDARAALRASNDPDAREIGLAWLRGAKPGFLYNLLPDVHPDLIRARNIVADYLLQDEII